jgi:hypothetical protein
MSILFFCALASFLIWLGVPWPVALGLVAAVIFFLDLLSRKAE